MKNDRSPAGMSRIWHKYGEDASVVVWEKQRKKRDYLVLAYSIFKNCMSFLSDISSINTVYAGTTPPPTTHGPGNVSAPGIGTTCVQQSPSDPRPDTNKVSFGLNQNARNQSWSDIKDEDSTVGSSLRGPPGKPVPLIAEYNGTSTDTVFTYNQGNYSCIARNRHRKGGIGFGLFIDIDGIVYAVAENSNTPILYRNWW